mmetsp:Transcript_12942/g.14809  ORF Transcript_12942/g.14809 Transcript_12942/m.14809 type:complete len:640 (-) Transcript_12942:90-2009(-)
MTLVDCPGHASLIRTIIGGAQIIDMVLLVVDAYKGWQAQTTECLVLAELTSPHLIVALNKIDMFPTSERRERLEQAKKNVWERLERTRFAKCTLVGISACVGGEKVASTKGEETQHKVSITSDDGSINETMNVDVLVRKLQQELPPPKRDFSEPTFYFSIDHCFPIRGQGTVLTGTVLSGNISVNSLLEFPTLGLERKVKSIQMFRRKVQKIGQGDRAGICISNLDPKLLERGIAASPGAVHLLKGAIAVVRKVSYFPGTLKSGSKFHISVGHTTIMASVTFWGAREFFEKGTCKKKEDKQDALQPHQPLSKTSKIKTLIGHSSLGGDADMAGLPRIKFDFQQDFLQQNSLLEELDGKASNFLHWAMLDFQTPVYCPLDSLIIGSRLDVEAPDSSSSSSCRLAFSGRIVEKVDPAIDSTRLKVYIPKEKRGVISKLGDPFRREGDSKVVRYEVFGDDLFKKETNMKTFTGMKLTTPYGDVGEIKGSYGTTGMFRVWFPAGTEAKEGDDLILNFKRYVHDTKKEMHQDLTLPRERVGTRLELQQKSKKKKKKAVKNGSVVSLKGDVLESNGKHTMAIITGFFTPEVNIRDAAGTHVTIPTTKEVGKVVGPFGKAGKCKVSFEDGISADVGAKAEMFLQQS